MGKIYYKTTGKNPWNGDKFSNDFKNIKYTSWPIRINSYEYDLEKTFLKWLDEAKITLEGIIHELKTFGIQTNENDNITENDGLPKPIKHILTEAEIRDWDLNITLNTDIFSHVQSLLQSKHYYNAVEESYKIVRKKLKEMTGKEKAHEAFSENNYEIIFGHLPQDESEVDFFEWVKFLHMAIQKLRNEKAHTPANEIDKNLAIHYIVLASLSYDLINK